jgi:integrase
MAGRPVDPEDYVIQNSRGGRVARQRIAEMIREAARLATETRLDQGLPPLPRTTPHSLRRTYISIALLANNFDVKWVMNQVGHADSKMTLDVYAQLEQRVKREHGVRFDALVRSAEHQMHGEAIDPSDDDESLRRG